MLSEKKVNTFEQLGGGGTNKQRKTRPLKEIFSDRATELNVARKRRNSKQQKNVLMDWSNKGVENRVGCADFCLFVAAYILCVGVWGESVCTLFVPQLVLLFSVLLLHRYRVSQKKTLHLYRPQLRQF